MTIQTSSDRHRTPSFLFIGASKSGSSWFFEILREHPQVFVPANKATFFFSNYHAKGTDWYEAFFTRAAPGDAIGEVCHDYLVNPVALRRIRAFRPDMRLVCCLRNPYARALSSWRFFRRNGMDEPTLEAQGERHPSVFDQGYYATQLSKLYSIFPKDQVMIFFFEELSTAPQLVARRLYEFIGVARDFHPSSLFRRVNVNAKPRLRLLARLMQHIHEQSWKRSRRLSDLIGQIKQIRPLRHFVRAALYKETESSADWRDHIAEFPRDVLLRYESEIHELENMLGKDLSAWHAPSLETGQVTRSSPPSSSRTAQDDEPDAAMVSSDGVHALSSRSKHPGAASPASAFEFPLTTSDKN